MNIGGSAFSSIGSSANKAARRRSIGSSAGAIGRRVNRQPARRSYPTPQPSYRPPVSNSSGRYSRPSSPPSGGSGSVPSIKKPPPSLGSYLGGDSAYQNQLRNFNRTLKNFLADVGDRRGKLRTEYGLSSKALKDQRGKDLDLMEEDFASRGLLKSGVYAGEVGDYEKEYGKRYSDLTRSQRNARASLDRETGKYRGQDRLNRQSAREAAARRRAEKYGM